MAIIGWPAQIDIHHCVQGEKVTLYVEVDVKEKESAYMNENFPLALERVKMLAPPIT